MGKPRKPKHSARPVTVGVSLRIASLDRRLTAEVVSEVLEKHFWHLADDLTGLLVYGGPGVMVKPVVQVTAIVVREERPAEAGEA